MSSHPIDAESRWTVAIDDGAAANEPEQPPPGEWLMLEADRAVLACMAQFQPDAAAYDPPTQAAATYERVRDAEIIARLRGELASANSLIAALRVVIAATDAPTAPKPASGFPANATKHAPPWHPLQR